MTDRVRSSSLSPALVLAGLLAALTACERGPALDPQVAEIPHPSVERQVDDDLADAGAWYFRRNCSACHMVGGGGALIGPNLEGVTERREMPWIAAMIRRPDSMVMHDSVARALLMEYQVPMANRQLDGARIRAILEFLWRADRGVDGSPSAHAAAFPAPNVWDERGRTGSGIAWSAAGAGPPLVLIHGTNLDRRVFGEQVAGWSEDRRVIAYDLRNHGSSEDAEGPWSDVDDLVEVLEDAGSDDAVLVGLSAGASVALEATLAHPDRFDGLVLVSPSIRGYRPAPGEVPDVFGPLMEALGAGDLEAAGAALLETPTMAVPESERARVERMIRENVRLFSVDPSWAAPPDSAPLSLLERVRVPTLVLAGGDDMRAVLSQARLLGSGIAGAEVQVVEGGGHLLTLTHPKEIQERVADWLARR